MADKQGQRCHTRRMWQTLRDRIITARTRQLIANRECAHDGAAPACAACRDDCTTEDRCGW